MRERCVTGFREFGFRWESCVEWHLIIWADQMRSQNPMFGLRCLPCDLQDFRKTTREKKARSICCMVSFVLYLRTVFEIRAHLLMLCQAMRRVKVSASDSLIWREPYPPSSRVKGLATTLDIHRMNHIRDLEVYTLSDQLEP